MKQNILQELGFRQGWIYEVIAETRGHLAPMGIWTDDLETLKMEIYRTAQTCGNILEDEKLTINFVDDIGPFFDSLAGKRITKEDTSAQLEVRVRKASELGEKIRFELDIMEHNIMEEVALINRAKYLALEALIESTKPKPSGEKIKGKYDTIKKIAPGSAYERALVGLLKTHHRPEGQIEHVTCE